MIQGLAKTLFTIKLCRPFLETLKKLNMMTQIRLQRRRSMKTHRVL